MHRDPLPDARRGLVGLVAIPAPWAETAALRLARRQGGLRPGLVIADQDQWEFLAPAGTSAAWPPAAGPAYRPDATGAFCPTPNGLTVWCRPDSPPEALTGGRS